MKKIITLLTAVILIASCAKEDPYFLVESNSDIVIKAYAPRSTDDWNSIEIVLPKGKIWRFLHGQVYKIEVKCEECSYFIDGDHYEIPNTFTVSPKLVSPLYR